MRLVLAGLAVVFCAAVVAGDDSTPRPGHKAHPSTDPTQATPRFDSVMTKVDPHQALKTKDDGGDLVVTGVDRTLNGSAVLVAQDYREYADQIIVRSISLQNREEYIRMQQSVTYEWRLKGLAGTKKPVTHERIVLEASSKTLQSLIGKR